VSDPVVETHRLTRRFGDVTAVDELDLTIPRGTVYGLLGPNGSGKTTAMRLLTGILRPSGGHALVLGTRLPGDAEPLKRKIGYMTQGFTYYRDLTVLENLDFSAAIHGLRPREKRRRIEELLDTYALHERAHVMAGAMSGGERQRLALAATVMHRPELLFLDEPTAAVDPESRRSFWEQLFDLVDAGTTMVVSTHLMDEAERCHRIAILDHGRKCADGAPREMMDRAAGRVIEVAGPMLRPIGQRLKASDSILSVAQIGTRLRVLVADGIDEPQNAVDVLLEGVTGTETAPVRPNLEDVFVLATREGRA
jgi:ABC-2 type transport system ATP-binding protein